MHPVRPSLALVVALAACAEVAPFVPAPPSAGIVCRLRRPALGTRSTRCEMARATRVNAELAGVLLVTDEVSGVQVCLVPAMHYNPVSIQRAVDVVDAFAAQQRLAAVVIELCPSRYSGWKNQATTWRRAVLMNEMHVAGERARLAGATLVLGDQPIEDLGSRARQIFFHTLQDLASPHSGGWAHCAQDILTAAKSIFTHVSATPSTVDPGQTPGGDARNHLDLAIVVCAPVSIVRYSLAWMIGAPVTILALALGITVCWLLPDIVANTVVSTAAAIDVQWGSVTIHDSAAILDAILKAAETEAFYCGKSLLLSRNLCWPDQAYEDYESYMADAGTVFVAFGQLAVSARVMLVAVLEERNKILADNIRQACTAAAANWEGGSRSSASVANDDRGYEGSTVVSVLGMAHVQGVARLLHCAPVGKAE